MIQFDPNNVRYDDAEARRTDGKTYEIAFALGQRKKRVMLQAPRKLAWVLRQCALAPVLAATVAESAGWE